MFNTHTYQSEKAGKSGWSMVELLVVIAIVSILTVVSIPIMNMFGKNDLRDGARTIYTMLRAARVYAMTYNVETAVVYGLDEEFLATGPVQDTLPVDDSVSPPIYEYVRCIRAAAIMYRLPDEISYQARLNPQVSLPDNPNDGLTPVVHLDAGDSGFTGRDDIQPDVIWKGTFVHAPRVGGDFVELPDGLAILLRKPPEPPFSGMNLSEIIAPSLFRFDGNLNQTTVATDYGAWYTLQYNRQKENMVTESGSSVPGLELLGMIPIHVHYDYVDRQAPPGGGDFYFVTATHKMGNLEAPLVRPHIAHVFTPRGSLKTRTGSRERYRIWVAPDPWQPREDRVFEYDGNVQLLGIPIEIHSATGRVKLGQ